MALTTCLDCGREISSLAPACIHCGRPTQPQAQVAQPQTPYTAPGCPLCGTQITHPNASTGGIVWCSRCGGQLVYGTDGALVRALPRALEPVAPPRPATRVVVVGSHKSVGVAMLLTFFFGPLGMLYSTVGGAFVMFFATFFVALITMGFGLIIMWPLSVLWAGYAASEHNRRLGYGTRVGS
jgi:hypothetical protein